MATRKIAAVMVLDEPSAMTATIEGDNNVTIYRGHRQSFPCEYEPGGPPVSEAELQGADIEIYTDAARNNRLGANDENQFLHEIDNIDTTAHTFDLIIDLTGMGAGITAQSYYIYLVVEQG